jgi:NTP pyrophosphatase (non-canonical NTP hydrolase)
VEKKMTDRLTAPLVTGLENIQKSFENYQNKAFPPRTSSFFALELCGECGELANLEKKQWRAPEKNINFSDFSAEAADVFIALVNYCNTKGICLEQAVAQKLVHIEDRRLAGNMGKTK